MAETGGRKGSAYLVGAVFGVLLLAGYFLRHTLSAVLTSLAIAFLLNPVLKFLEKRCSSRMTAMVVLYASCAVVILVLTLLLFPYVGQQAELLTSEMPRYLQNVNGAMARWRLALAPYYGGAEDDWLISQAEGVMATISDRLSGIGIERLKGALYGVFNLVLAPIFVFFMLMYREFVKGMLARMLPDGEREYMVELGRRINRSLERFIFAMLVDCLLVGILCVFALLFLGIKFPLLNGLFAGAASAVPVVGGVLAVLPPVFLGYAAGGDLSIIPKVCAAYFAIFVIIEGNLIKPLVMRTTLKLNPLAVIFAVMAMGELLGFWGIILAVPLAALVKVCAGEIRQFFLEGGKW